LSQEKAKRKVNCHMTNARKRIREMKAIAGEAKYFTVARVNTLIISPN
jgi:hypothetical protein